MGFGCRVEGMKKILGILVLGLGFLLFDQNQASAAYISDEKCADLAGDANTDWASGRIYLECKRQEEVFFSIMYEPRLKCAIKAGKAKTRNAALKIWRACKNK